MVDEVNSNKSFANPSNDDEGGQEVSGHPLNHRSSWHYQLKSICNGDSESELSLDPHIEYQEEIHSSLMTLKEGIALTRSQPEKKWDVLLVGGLHTLLSQFAHLSRTLGSLHESGVSIAVVEPEAVLMGSDGRFSLLAQRLKPRHDLDLDLVAPRIAPEILLANHEKDLKEGQIVYAVAVLLHECVLGSPPWSGRDATEVADRLLSGNSLLENVDTSLNPPGLKGLLSDALSLDPARRPATLRGFARMLEAVRDGERPRSRSKVDIGGGVELWKLRVALFAMLIIVVTLLGRFLESDGDTSEMIEDFQRAMLVRPLPAHGEEQPLADNALRWFQRYELRAREASENPFVQRQFAWVCLRSGELERAREAARHAARSKPQSPGPWIILGIVALEQGDHSGRIEVENGLKLEAKDSFDVWSKVAGHMYLLQPIKALDQLHLLTMGFPDDANAWFHRALCELRSGQISAARNSIDRCRDLNPLDGWGDWLHAEIALAESRFKVTESILESSQLRLNEDVALAMRTSSLWSRLGREKTAEEWSKRSRGSEEEWRHVEWRPGGRLVLPGRSVLFLGPPMPPEEK
ncbi:MAG: hypothetical protein CBC13_07150 [Planctomycetia bacterium TMED53]|nr:MAG: hypothetical protein CBC13_07150 [Planctomycetia bacterium TMED53]